MRDIEVEQAENKNFKINSRIMEDDLGSWSLI